MIRFSLNQKYNRDNFCPFLHSFVDDFREDVYPVHPDYKTAFATEIFHLGESRDLELEVFEIHHSSNRDARVGIAKDAFKILLHESYCNRALVAFVPEESTQWRFSLIEMEASIGDKSTRITRSYSNPRRHSFLLGEGGTMTTPKKYLFEMGTIHARREGTKELTAIEDLQSRFSVEALTKEFYNQLYNWYLWAVEPSTGVTFPNLVTTSADDRDDISIKVIRLITRLLFVWFIKQKGLVPNDIFNEAELDNILANFKPQAMDDGKYYNAILQNLFFATLNNEIGKRRFMTEPYMGTSDSYGVKTLFRDSTKASWFKIPHDEVLKLFKKVPFMNCGLFECLDKYKKSDLGVEDDRFLDGFSSRDSKQDGNFKYRAFVPNNLFFANEHYETVTVEENGQSRRVEIPVMGIIQLLKLYNFTVQENTPTDMEVSLDPELLGQVFENLLAAYNPETKESARKSTGSFYTPRPIVEYMVNESLVEYLKTKVDASLEDTWRILISFEDKEFELAKDKREAILNALYDCKVLDPACGSGAFPMGMLQQMVHIIRKVDPDNAMWKELVLKKAIASMEEVMKTETKEARKKRLDEIEQAFEDSEENPDYTRKLYLIQNCIYGSDIQPIAMLISKLRFFISLICEQDEKKIDFDDIENNYGINTLPNLETKFVAANSLLKAEVRNYADDDWTNDPYLIKLKNDLLKIRQTHFMVRTQSSKLNKRNEDKVKREEIMKYILESTTQPDQYKIQTLEARIEHLKQERLLYEGEKIVEEYVDTQASLFDDVQKQYVRKDVNKIRRDQIDTEIKRCEEGIRKENNKRNPVGFNAAIKQITDWNPYDQLKAAPFFDPDWMFGVTEGFDIVIGNPPYVQLQGDSGKYAKLYESCGYETFARTGDMYCLFYERGWQSLKSGGHLCYITSNKWMRAGYGELTREFFSTQTNPKLLIDFSGTKVFESATVDTNILLFEKGNNRNQTKCCVTKKLDKNGVSNLSLFVQQNSSINSFTGSDSWVILSPIEQSIKRKIESVGTPLSEWDINIYRGVLTGYNDAFIISTEKRDQILAACKTEDERSRTAELIRPILRGRDIKRYGYEWANLWLIYIPWHFPMQFDNSIQGASLIAEKAFKDQYPVVYAHMLQYKKELSARNKAETGIRYEWYAMQRWGSNYWDLFFQPKICWKAVGRNLTFAIVDSGTFLTAPASFISAGFYNKYLLAFLCSNIGRYYIYQNSDTTGAGDIMLNIQSLIKFPIPKSDKFYDLINNLVDEQIQCFSDHVQTKINDVIYKLYNFDNDEIEEIENC